MLRMCLLFALRRNVISGIAAKKQEVNETNKQWFKTGTVFYTK